MDKAPAALLGLACLLLSPPLNAAPGDLLAIEIDLPSVLTAEQRQKVDQTRPIIQALLGPQAQARVSGNRFHISGYDLLDSAQSAGLVARLQALWSEESYHLAVQRTKPASASALAAAPASSIGRTAGIAMPGFFTPALLSGQHQQAYDGSARSLSASAPSVVAPSPGGSRQPLLLTAPAVRAAATRQPPSPVITVVAAGSPYEREIQNAATETGVDANILRAVAAAKSKFDADNAGGGAYGLMGISPGTARVIAQKYLGFSAEQSKDLDLSDPKLNLRVGAILLSELLSRFNGDVNRALAAYQVGPRKVIESGGIPNDAGVKHFLEAFHRAYRGSGGPKPPVTPTEPPKAPNVRRIAETIKEFVAPLEETERWGSARYRPLIQEIARRHGVDPALIEAIVNVESSGNPNAIGRGDEIGLMQLMPDTARGLGVDPAVLRNPRENLEAGTKLVKLLMDHFHQDPVLAIAAYNAGEPNVLRTNRYFMRRSVTGAECRFIPTSTRVHVRKVMDFYNKLGGKPVDIGPYIGTPR